MSNLIQMLLTVDVNKRIGIDALLQLPCIQKQIQILKGDLNYQNEFKNSMFQQKITLEKYQPILEKQVTKNVSGARPAAGVSSARAQQSNAQERAIQEAMQYNNEQL